MKKALILTISLFQILVNSQELKDEIIFKGNILNLEDNSPIIYATIILQKENIYRVTNENVFFEFSINKNLIPNTILEVSSIGFETKKISLSKFKNNIFLKPKVEKLSEVIIKAKKKISALEVIRKVIKRKKENYPIKPFNQKRFTSVKTNEQDKVISDFEFISKEYHQGYKQLDVATRKIEQIKWNVGNNQNSVFKNSDQIYHKRQDPMQYAGYLDKGKYKNYTYKFVYADDITNEDFFVIDFKSNKTKWKFTQFDNEFYHNKIEIKAFTGRLFVRKKDFTVTKVIEEWNAESKNKDLSNSLWVKTKQYYVKNIKSFKIKQREVFEYETLSDNKNYPSKFLETHFIESFDNKNNPFMAFYSVESFFFDLDKNNVESFPWEGYRTYGPRKYSLFEKVTFKSDFWKAFYDKYFDKKEKNN